WRRKAIPGSNWFVRKRKPTRPAQRARQEIDYGRRGKGYIFGAFCPATGEALTKDYLGRTINNWVDFLGQVEAWVPTEIGRLYAIVDNLNVHRATDVLLFCLQHPRWGTRLRRIVRRELRFHQNILASVRRGWTPGAA